MADLSNAKFLNANLKNATFWIANLKDTIFAYADITNTNFEDAKNLSEKVVEIQKKQKPLC